MAETKLFMSGYVRKMLADAAITGRDPGAKVILGGLFAKPLGGRHPVIPAADYLAELYRRPGLAAAFDGVAAHPYGARLEAVRVQVEAMREWNVVPSNGDQAHFDSTSSRRTVNGVSSTSTRSAMWRVAQTTASMGRAKPSTPTRSSRLRTTCSRMARPVD